MASDARSILTNKLAAWRSSSRCPKEAITHVAAANDATTQATAVIYRGQLQDDTFGDGRFNIRQVQMIVQRSEVATIAVSDKITLPNLAGGTEVAVVKNITFQNSAVIEFIGHVHVRKSFQDVGDQRDRNANRNAVT